MRHKVVSLAACVACCVLLSTAHSREPGGDWPPLTATAKPWARWWWPGSAVEAERLSAELAAFAAAGLGGVEITPIYGARGADERYLEFLSPRWVAMLEHSGRRARALGLGVDMATGTGWPFGGPWVSDGNGATSLVLREGRLAGEPTRMLVKRAAPGGVGLVVDPYSSTAMQDYLRPFSAALGSLPAGLVRSQFHDSFEYYGASFTSVLPERFQQMHGYDLQQYAHALVGGSIDPDTLGRIKGDYRRTLAALHGEYMGAWLRWSHEHGFKARNQAHGAPANLLDLYGAVDIPETESFGAPNFPIAGLRQDAAGSTLDPDPADALVGRLASSAGHVMGRALISSETFTWLRENFRESPSAAKPQLDRLFAAGINHIFYHGITYSPADAPWPGWFFYAATQLSTANPLWDDFAAINAYVARTQSILQQGRPDNDILLYWPHEDLADDSAGLMKQYAVHELGWLLDSAAGRLASQLVARGHTFDFISDAQLLRLSAERGAAVAPGGRYRAIVVPATRRMPVETLAQLVELMRQGVTVVFETLPQDVPGFGRLSERRARFQRLLASEQLSGAVVSGDVLQRLEAIPLRREAAPGAGLTFTRRARDDGHDYFLANLGARDFDGWLPLATPAAAALLLDPLTARSGTAAMRRKRSGSSIYLQLASGESVMVRTYSSNAPRAPTPRWRYVSRMGPAIELQGEWQVNFIKGGPVLPGATKMNGLASWTSLSRELQRFAGTARYRIEFDAPPSKSGQWLLDLGDVRETARIRLNGEAIGTAWSVPFVVRLTSPLKRRHNVLEIEVTNLPANRIRDLDVRKVDWKIMNDANLVTLRYRPFDASAWEVAPAGLLGPVKLVPVAPMIPGG